MTVPALLVALALVLLTGVSALGAWASSDRRECEDMGKRTGLQVRYEGKCQAMSFDGHWQDISPR